MPNTNKPLSGPTFDELIGFQKITAPTANSYTLRVQQLLQSVPVTHAVRWNKRFYWLPVISSGGILIWFTNGYWRIEFNANTGIADTRIITEGEYVVEILKN